MGSSIEAEFDAQTAGIVDPVIALPGEVISPGQETTESEAGASLADFVTDDLVAEILGLPGAVMHRKTGEDYWQITPEEKRVLGKGAGPAVRYLVQKYLTEQSGPFAAMGAALGVVYGPKLIRMKMEMDEQKRRERRVQEPPRNSTEGSASSSDSKDAENQPSSSEWQPEADV